MVMARKNKIGYLLYNVGDIASNPGSYVLKLWKLVGILALLSLVLPSHCIVATVAFVVTDLFL